MPQYHKKQMQIFWWTTRPTRFLMSDEDRKIFFAITSISIFLTCFSLTSHMSDLTLPFIFPFPPFSQILASVQPSLFICTHSFCLYFLHFLHPFLRPFAFFARKKWCFLYAWNMKCRKLYFSFQTWWIRLNFLQNETSAYFKIKQKC